MDKNAESLDRDGGYRQQSRIGLREKQIDATIFCSTIFEKERYICYKEISKPEKKYRRDIQKEIRNF